MNWGHIILAILFLGVLALTVFLTWVYLRRDIKDLSKIPAFKKWKPWQLVVGVLVIWAAIDVLVGLFS